jgi:hypothetical protein
MEGQFQYELIECRGISNSAQCSFRITNRGIDRNLYHYCGSTMAGYNSRAFDNAGNESYAEMCVIGNQESDTGPSVHATLISGVPVEASILFPRIGASASSLSLITIIGVAVNNSTNATTNMTVSFRSVPLVR